jgi:hypothetical protein
LLVREHVLPLLRKLCLRVKRVKAKAKAKKLKMALKEALKEVLKEVLKEILKGNPKKALKEETHKENAEL